MTDTGLTILSILGTLAAIGCAVLVHRVSVARQRVRERAIALGDAVSNLINIIDGPGSLVHGKWVNDQNLSLRDTTQYQAVRELTRLKVRRS